MRILKQPIKVVDNFFEAPGLWQHYALKQQFTSDENSTWPGLRTTTLDTLSMPMFSYFASNLVKHLHDKKFFSLLKVNFASVDGSYNIGWMHQDEPKYNVAGVVFLSNNPPANTGLSFYTKIDDSSAEYNSMFFDELKADAADRTHFIKFKEEQRTHFKRNMTVENRYNRCVMFSPETFHAADGYFGQGNDARLTITFFGIAV